MHGIPNDVPNDIPSDADTWKSDSSISSNYGLPVSRIFKEKIEGTLGAANIKPAIPNVS